MKHKRTLEKEKARLHAMWMESHPASLRGWFIFGAMWGIAWSMRGKERALGRPSKFARGTWACDKKLEAQDG